MFTQDNVLKHEAFTIANAVDPCNMQFIIDQSNPVLPTLRAGMMQSRDNTVKMTAPMFFQV